MFKDELNLNVPVEDILIPGHFLCLVQYYFRQYPSIPKKQTNSMQTEFLHQRGKRRFESFLLEKNKIVYQGVKGRGWMFIFLRDESVKHVPASAVCSSE